MPAGEFATLTTTTGEAEAGLAALAEEGAAGRYSARTREKSGAVEQNESLD